MTISVVPDWILSLPLQQQSVVLLGSRGPDGVAKDHPCKDLVRAYRGTVFLAAKYGRVLRYGEKADSFMCLEPMLRWDETLRRYFSVVDSLPHHYHLHLMHGAQILGYKHPDEQISLAWTYFYNKSCDDMHLTPETVDEMDERLSDWQRRYWSDR